MALLARVVGRHQVLAPVLDPFDRPAEAHRGEADQHILGVELAADAEAAADIALLQHAPRRAAAEHAGERVAVAVRHLGGAVQLQHVARGVVARQRAARLQRHAAVAADRQVELDDRVRRGERGVDVAVFGAQHERLGRLPGRELPGGAAASSSGGSSSTSTATSSAASSARYGVGREHRGDRLADIAQPVPRQQRLAIGAQRLAGRVAEIDRRQIGDVGAGPDRDDAGRGQRRRDVDAAQHGMGVGRAHDAHVQLVREADIADELAAPGEQRRVLEPRDRAAENATGERVRGHADHFRPSRSSAIAARTAATMP